MQTAQRPPVEAIKVVDIPRGPPPRPVNFGTPQASVPTPAGRGPPPRVLQADFNAAAKPAESKVVMPVKPGSIPMFEQPQAPQEPAAPKPQPVAPAAPAKPSAPPGGIMTDPTEPMRRTPRPPPPKPQPAGIPEKQPLPPTEKPPRDKALAAPAVLAVPDRSRAPPRDEPKAPTRSVEQPPAPTDKEPPSKRGKKEQVLEYVYIKRREREHPEFEESSSSDEELDKVTGEPKRTYVKQPEKPVLLKAEDIIAGKLAQAQKVEAPTAPVAAKSAAPVTSATFDASTKQREIYKATEKESQKVPPLIEEEVQKGMNEGGAASQKNLLQKPEEEQKKVDPFEEFDYKSSSQKAKQTVPDDDSDVSSVGTTGEQPVGMPPDMGMKDALTSSFVPPPPTDYEVYIDQSDLGKKLPRGRLSIKCKQGYDIRKAGDNSKVPRIDPYVRIKLGVAERHPWKATKAKRKQNAFPKFDNEIVYFDLTDPGNFIFQEDMQILIEVMNKSTFKDELIASVNMSVVRFLKNPFIAYDEKIPIFHPGAKISQCKLGLEFIFEEARTGLFQITLYEGRGLRNVDPMGQLNPYVQLNLGDFYKKRSKQLETGGPNPFFNEEEVLIWADQLNWIHDLRVNVLDEGFGEEKPVGNTHFSLLPYMNTRPDDAAQDDYDLFYQVPVDPNDEKAGLKDVAYGELTMRVRFYPAGKLTVTIDKAKGVLFPENFVGDANRMDPYVNLSLEGKAIKSVKRTPADKDGGSTPAWSYDLPFEVVDQYMLDLELLNQSSDGKDVLMGSVQISLLTVFRNGDTSQWWTLKQRKVNGGVREAGDIFVRLQFTGPIGIAYPQLRPEVDSFDDQIRQAPKEKPKALDEDEIVVKDLIPTIPDPSEKYVAPEKTIDQAPPPAEFSEDEIVAAFKFIDLDHNNFVGASEIRHILVCMGELVTDDEIDMMISMVDLDGDGQVSFREFRTLVLHPNPGMVDIAKEVDNAREAAYQEEKNLLNANIKGTDLSAFQRQKEMTQREAKKKMLVTFVYDNELNFNSIQAAFREYMALPRSKRPLGRVKFEEFVKCLGVDAIQEYRNLHALFDNEELGDLDFREFLFSLMNFITVDREARVRFSFKAMDEDQTDYIAQREVEEILRGNHMVSLASVKRKAETILKQALSVRPGCISENELVIVSKKFPNIMLPNIGLNKKD